MTVFICLFDSDGSSIPDVVRRPYEALARSRGVPFRWQSMGQVQLLTAEDDPNGESLAVSDGDWVAVGRVRLDNRPDLERWIACQGRRLSDLELVLRAVALRGTECISQVLGDFAFVIWNAVTRTAVAACDIFAVKKLYYAQRNRLLAFASHAEAIALEDLYDVQYLAERVAACDPSPGLTVYAAVRAVPAATIVLVTNGNLTTRRYWSVYDFDMDPALAASEDEVIETCRHLIAESVRLRVNGRSDTWSQLSGGMDSSSVVSVAQWLNATGALDNGLAGTVSFADSHGTGGDEREYSDAVARHWRVRNETIVDAPLWEDDNYPPPRLDQPNAGFVLYPRDCRLCAIVRAAGGRVLLTGTGGDSLFTGNMFFFADWVARGRLVSAMREMTRRAAIGRVSVWELGYRNVVLPLLPRGIQHRLVRDAGQMPAWVLGVTARRFQLHLRVSAPASYAGRVGSKYHDGVAAEVAVLVPSLPLGVVDDALDVRHPFLYRPLVEFALRLPPELCVRPYARKWILRQAMQGILPETVRTRVGKGQPYGRFGWSLTAQRALLEALTREPILADLGIVDAATLRTAYGEAQHGRDGRDKLCAAVHTTLAIEAWLQLRSGRWPWGGNKQQTRSNHSYQPSCVRVHRERNV